MMIEENIARIRAGIDVAARESGRSGSQITLVGASKMNDADACRRAYLRPRHSGAVFASETIPAAHGSGSIL